MADGVCETIDGAQRDHESWHIGAGADLAACIIFVDDFEMNSSVVNHQFVRYRARGADAVPAAKVGQMAMAALFGERVRSCSLLGECCPRLARAWSGRSRRERGETMTLCARGMGQLTWRVPSDRPT